MFCGAGKRTLPRFLRLCRRRLKNALSAERRHLPLAKSAFFSAAVLFYKILKCYEAAGFKPIPVPNTKGTPHSGRPFCVGAGKRT